MSNDPDDKATAEAAAVLKHALADKGVTLTQRDVQWLAFTTICKWLEARTRNWAAQRGKARFGEPDAMTVGFAEAALSQIATKAAGLPMDLPIGKWAKNDVARLFAIAHEAIEATRIQTMEDPNDTVAA